MCMCACARMCERRARMRKSTCRSMLRPHDCLQGEREKAKGKAREKGRGRKIGKGGEHHKNTLVK